VRVHLQENATAEHVSYSREVRKLIKVAKVYHSGRGISVTAAYEEAGLSGSNFYLIKGNNKSLWEAMKSGGDYSNSFLDFIDFDLDHTDLDEDHEYDPHRDK